MERTVNNKYKIKIDLMPGDGNCLFSAIVHRLTELHHTHAVFHEAVSVMRRECVRHLYQSAGTYRNLIITEAIERGGSWPEEDRHDSIVSSYLLSISQNGIWAGSESIAAVRVTIRVFSVESSPLLFEGRAGNETINIFYNGVNHYDSVREVIELTGQGTVNRIDQDSSMGHTELSGNDGLANNDMADWEDDCRVQFRYFFDVSGSSTPVLKYLISPASSESLYYAIIHQLLNTLVNRVEFKK